MAKYSKLPFDQYVDQIMQQLHTLSDQKRAEIRAELLAHLQDAAVEYGRDPADPALQTMVIEHMGSSHRVGRDLARSYRLPTTSRGSYLAGGLGALLSAMLLAITLVLMFAGFQEGTIEFFLVISPLALLPVVFALHQIYHWVEPRWSFVTLIVGLVPFGAVGAALVASQFVVLDSPVVGAMMMVSLSFAGVWLILVGRLIRCGGATLPVALTWLGSILGVCWFVGLGGTAINIVAPHSVGAFSWLLGINAVLLLVLHQAWAVWLGSLFMYRTLRPGVVT